jgi:hypothetical protein
VSQSFVWTSGFILVLTAAAKLASVAGQAAWLKLPNAVVPFLKNAQVLALGGAIELLAVVSVYVSPDMILRLAVLAWLAAVFVFYRVALTLAGHTEGCRCLGNAGLWLGLEPATAEGLAEAALVYLGLGSFGLLGAALWFQRRREQGLGDGSHVSRLE